jgi:hypothetical protein
MQKCGKCGTPQHKCRIVDYRTLEKIGLDCGCSAYDHSADNVNSPYLGLVLEHVRDEKGKPVRVDSLRQMSEVEKKYNVVHAVTSYGENYHPPEKRQPTFKDLYRPMRERGLRPI